MFTRSSLYALAIVALANLFMACGPEIVTVTTEKVVEKTVLVCLDEAHTQVEAGQSCPDGEKPVVQYVCDMNGSTVPDAAMCPIWEVSCPEGTYLLTATEKAYKGCIYQETCHEGWAYETSTRTCKKFCSVGETLSADGLTCVAAPTPRSDTAVIVGFAPFMPPTDHVWQTLAGHGVSIAWLKALSNGYSELSDFDFTVELSMDDGATWTSTLQDVTAALQVCTIYENHPFGTYGNGVFRAAADGKAHIAFQYASGISLIGGLQEFGVLCDTNASFVAPTHGLRVSLHLNKAAPPDAAGQDVYYGSLNDRRDIYGTIRSSGVLEMQTLSNEFPLSNRAITGIPVTLAARAEDAQINHLTVEACRTAFYPCPANDRFDHLEIFSFHTNAEAGAVNGQMLDLAMTDGRADLDFAHYTLSSFRTGYATTLYMRSKSDVAAGTPFYIHVAFVGTGTETNASLEAFATIPMVVSSL